MQEVHLESMGIDNSIEELCYKMEQKVGVINGEGSGVKIKLFLPL